MSKNFSNKTQDSVKSNTGEQVEESERQVHWPCVSYRAEDLFQFIDAHKEFVALVFEPSQRVSIQGNMDILFFIDMVISLEL